MQKNGKPVGVRAAAINGRTIVLALRDETEQMNWHDGRIAGILIAEYGSWQEAVCSNDFEEINGDQYEKIKELEKRLENLTNNYKLLEKKQAIDIADGQALVDGLDDFDNVREVEKKLKTAVKALKWIEEQADTPAQYDYNAEVILKKHRI